MLCGTPVLIRFHLEVFAARAPLFMLFEQHGSKQSHGRGAAGKDPNYPFAAPQFLVQALLAVGRAQALTIAAG